MSASGIANASSVSTKQFESSFYINAAIFGAFIFAFTVLRTKLPLIYEPRSVLPIDSKRQEPLSDKIWKWPYEVFMADYSQIKRTNGMDAYFYLRFLRMAIRSFIPIWFLSWAILLPVTSVHTSDSGATGLDRFVFGNVGSEEQSRYWAHISLAYVFTGWICYNIKYEMRHFVQSRQHHLIGKAHSNSAQSRTLLITGIPSRYLTERQLFAIFSYLPGGVHKVWLNRDLKDLPDAFNAKLKAINQLEAAETKLLSIAAKIAKEQEGKGATTPPAKARSDSDPMEKEQRPTSGESTVPLSPAIDVERALPRAEAIVPKDKRPRHKLKAQPWLPFNLPFTGQTVDTIEWCRSEIVRCNSILRDGRAQWRKDMATDDDSADDFYKPLNSAFILFNQQIAAHLALQSVIHHDAYRMAGKYIEVAQEDVIWSNLSLNPYERRIRTVISTIVTIGLVILWAFPAAFIGALSNVQGLCEKYHWLRWLCDLNPSTTSTITGFLPPVLLALLMLVLPIVLRLLARFEGIPSRSGLELSVMERFFGFQVVHSFLVVTLSSGLIKALPDLLENPASVPALLAHNLPSASNFFLTYVILQGLTGSATGFFQLITLIIYYLRVILAGSTPRSLYNTKFGPRTVVLGTVFPATTLLMCITIAYSIISPLINGLACLTFFLLYMLNKYLFLWCMQQPPSQDTGGMFFTKAIQHVFVGLYIEQICLAALFFLARDVKEEFSAVPEAILSLLLIACTLIFQLTLNDSYRPLIKALPLTLADKTYGIKKDDAVEEGGEPAAPTGDKLQNEDGTQAFPEKFTGEASGVERYELQPRRGRTGDSGSSQNSKPLLVVESPSRKPSGHEGNIEEESTAESVLGEAAADDTTEDEGPTDFTHPAVSNHPHVVWIPMDKLGLANDEVEAIRAMGIDVSSDGATINDKGHVEITAPPPDIWDI